LTTGRIAGADFLRGKCNMTPASREQCYPLQQSRWCRYWFFCCVHCSSGSQCFTVGRRPTTLPNTWFILLTRVYSSIGMPIRSAVFAEFTNVNNRQTDTDRPRYSVCSNRSHLASAAMWPKTGMVRALVRYVYLLTFFTVNH